MILNLNLLHLLLVLGAMAALYFAFRETRGRVMRYSRLTALPMVVMPLALFLLLFQLAVHQPAWIFATTFVAGLAAGGLRGATTMLQVDQNWRLVRQTSGRTLIWVSLALSVAIALEVAGTLAGPPGMLWRLAAVEVVILCAGLIVGRTLVLALRLWRAPHTDLRR